MFRLRTVLCWFRLLLVAVVLRIGLVFLGCLLCGLLALVFVAWVDVVFVFAGICGWSLRFVCGGVVCMLLCCLGKVCFAVWLWVLIVLCIDVLLCCLVLLIWHG